MQWKKFMPYWIYFVSMLLMQMLIWFGASFLILVFAAIFPVVAIGLTAAVGLVGNALQHNLGRNSRIERFVVSAVGSFLIAVITPACLIAEIWFLRGALDFSILRHVSWWIFFGLHLLVMYVSMEVTYHLMQCNEEKRAEKKYFFPILCSGILIFLFAILAFGLKYQMDYKKHAVVKTVSPDGAYQLVISQVGSPDFPFGATHCQASLRRNGKRVQQYDFSVRNDGGNVSEHHFAVSWHTDCAEIISSGEEQGKEQITLYFDGTTKAGWLETQIEESYSEKRTAEDLMPEENAAETEEYIESKEIQEGYWAVFEVCKAGKDYDFTVSYGARGDSRVILKENEEMTEFLVYDRLSANEKCELYVLYRSRKAEDGSWSPMEAEILDIYAYEMSEKAVISSGKTSWSETGSREYCEATGEK